MIKSLIDLIIPNRCYCCAKLCDSSICRQCADQINVIEGKVCIICGKPIITDGACLECKKRTPSYNAARSLIYHEGVSEKLIKALKYENAKRIPEEIINKYINIVGNEFLECDQVTFIPSGIIKYLKRGYNQSELIAKAISKTIKKEIKKTLLFNRPVMDQTKLDRKERIKNLTGSFKVIADVRNKRILLVDDVFTSGTTVNEAAKALIKEGAIKVNVLTLCRRLL